MMQQVNLLVEELRPKREVLSLRQLAAAWAALGSLLVALSIWQGMELWRLSAEQKEKADQVAKLMRANAELKSTIVVETDRGLEAEVENMRQMQVAQESLVGAVLSYEASIESGFSPYLADLARHQVPGMWFSRISFTDGGSRIRLAGQTVDPVHVPVFLKRLASGGSFKGRRFDGLELQENESGLLQFEMSGHREAQGG